MTGTPSKAVIQFTGSRNFLAMMSQRSMLISPVSIVAGTSIRWSALLNSNRVTCGTANPIKPTGPQNAVTGPVSSAVEMKMSVRALDIHSHCPCIVFSKKQQVQRFDADYGNEQSQA